ncbi:MAG: ATP-binding protein [Acidobacteria bacterium]|nr:ATP-binding protein [Acidobacteriota bacterium]
MDHALLTSLLEALRLSPANHVLRRQVAQGLLEAGCWDSLGETVAPLLATDYRAYALFCQSKLAWHQPDGAKAKTYYREAIQLDAQLCDEQYEAEINPMGGDDFELPSFPANGSSVREYTGPRITFQDVGGMEPLKEQIRLKILYPFTRPELYAAYGKKTGGGILLYGPPGCGKTYLARATAGEMGACFYPVELSDILSKYIGETERQIHDIFETARAHAPSVIFIDEVDALGAKRGELAGSYIRSHVTQLLTEMDGLNAQNHDLLILGATNEPWNVDSAFRRPGRFDRVLFVPPPDSDARQVIMQLHSRERKFDHALSWREIGEKTDMFSGADLADLVDRACENALQEALKTGIIRNINVNDVLAALKAMRPSTTEWLRRAKNYVTYGNQDGYYNDLAAYLSEKKVK